MDSWAIKLPVPRSEEIADIGFTGRYAIYEHADTWYPSCWVRAEYLDRFRKPGQD